MKIEYRQARIIAATEGRNFNGYAVRWDDVTAPLAELRGYKEKIKRGALRFDANTALFMGHAYENQVPLARVGSGTMEVEEDNQGLAFRSVLPAWATAVQESLERGDLAGAVSIGFIAEEDEFDNRLRLRTVTAGYLHHVALVMQGAYPNANGVIE